MVTLKRHAEGWLVTTAKEQVMARTVVDAAGAWAGRIGTMAGARDLRLAPLRRSAALVDAPAGMPVSEWPAVLDVDEQFYMKPEAGVLMISPANETPEKPGDAQPDELDIAIAVDRIQGLAALDVARIRHKWAGLRTFVADGSPVVGFDPQAPDFFWLAALGGYGIQTAPALGRLAADILLGANPATACAQVGVRPDAIDPARASIGVPQTSPATPD